MDETVLSDKLPGWPVLWSLNQVESPTQRLVPGTSAGIPKAPPLVRQMRIRSPKGRAKCVFRMIILLRHHTVVVRRHQMRKAVNPDGVVSPKDKRVQGFVPVGKHA